MKLKFAIISQLSYISYMFIYKFLSFLKDHLLKFLIVIIGFAILQFLVRAEFGAYDIAYIVSFAFSQFIIIFVMVYTFFYIKKLIKKRHKELELINTAKEEKEIVVIPKDKEIVNVEDLIEEKTKEELTTTKQ